MRSGSPEVDVEYALKLTKELVRIPSVTGEEGEIAKFLAEELSGLGLRVELRRVQGDRFNVIGVLKGEEKGIALAFHGHTDTVPPYGMEDPFSAEEDEEHIYGRGSCDQKAGLAASIAALKAIVDSGIELRKGLAFLGVVDEEREHRGSYALVEDGFKADAAICTEPTGLEIAVGCKGTLPVKITTFGKAAHGSAPWRGVNAVYKMAKVLLALEELEPKSVTVPGVGEVRGSLNVGLIRGGEAYNIVPDSCSIWIDRRLVPGETPEDALREIREILDELGRSDPDFRAELSVDRPDWEWEPIKKRGLKPCLVNPEEDIVRWIREAHESVAGDRSKLKFSSGYFEMDFLVNDLGIPTVAYGPGDPELAHTPEERVSKRQIVIASRVYAAVAMSAAQTA